MLMRFIFTILLIFPFAFSLSSQPETLPSNGYIVMLKPGQKAAFKSFVQAEAKAFRSSDVAVLSDALEIYHIFTESEKLLSELKNKAFIHHINPNRRLEYRGTVIPSDPLWIDQWGLEMIRAPQAWNYTTGGKTLSGRNLVAAIVDNGCDLEHEDLTDNIWINTAETPGNGLDDDLNGYVDDVFGWNVSTQSGLSHPAGGHGTAMAGIIGARGNNGIGVSGVNWEVDLMIISGAVFESDVIQAYEYARVQRQLYNESQGLQGALVVATNSSFGISNAWPENAPHWCAMYDALGEVGILNAGATDNANINVDEVGDIPSTCPSPYLIVVTETNQQDRKAQTAAFGKTYVDLGAPGDSHMTTRVGSLYATTSGTSTATAFVTGAIALLASFPNADWEQMMFEKPAEAALLLKEFILRGVTNLPDLQGKTTTGGRLDLLRSMQLMEEYFEGFSETTHILNVYPNPFTDRLYINLEAPEPGYYVLELYDLTGRKIKSGQFELAPFSFKSIEIDLSEFPSSVYLLRLTGNEGFSSFKKVVKLP